MPILGLGVFENDDCTPACLAALQCGYRHIDSARYYKNEDRVGDALRQSRIPREQVFVTSKIYHPEHGYQNTLAALDDSLRNLGYEYFDLYLIHSPLSGKEVRLETWRALVDAKKAGKIKSIGVSNYSGKHIDEIRDAGYELPSVNQVELHPFCQQRPIVEYCRKNGVVVQAYSPLIQGRLDNPVFTELAKKYNKDAARIVIRWSLQHGHIPLPKSSRPERILSNSQVFDFEISAEDMERLDSLDRGKDGAITWNPVDAP
ncbi:Aldo/keto reductase [Trametes versicolor FP-101664 SS1]|uniref:Aldo/keto reductase n=1 Tax=Trametes versicolor (strain FP-101664) TaxID=717944 RepID=UPI0004622FCA|nr:Aldo/keto reductase [Trametes versicolor FP-101664 SS1]EIW62563.1 Aldo/keto reductase [Trametes versicolor FP-101664 SS1]